MMRQPGCCSSTRARDFSTRSGGSSWVRLKMMVLAVLIWSRKNSPKFFMYMRHLPASTTVAQPAMVISCRSEVRSTAARMSLSLPTPEGSMISRSGWYFSISSSTAFWKSPTRVQQMQPLFISVTVMPASFIKLPSTPTSPYSFSSRMIFSSRTLPPRSFLMSVVLPAPRKPEMMLTLTMECLLPFLLDRGTCAAVASNLKYTTGRRMNQGAGPGNIGGPGFPKKQEARASPGPQRIDSRTSARCSSIGMAAF